MKRFISYIVCILLVIAITLASLLYIFSNTVLNENYILETLENNNYYEKTYDNIKAGTYWIARYYKSWGKYYSGELLERNALNAYNFGDGGYRNYLNNGGTAYSWKYANKVLEAKTKLVENGGL